MPAKKPATTTSPLDFPPNGPARVHWRRHSGLEAWTVVILFGRLVGLVLERFEVSAGKLIGESPAKLDLPRDSPAGDRVLSVGLRECGFSLQLTSVLELCDPSQRRKSRRGNHRSPVGGPGRRTVDKASGGRRRGCARGRSDLGDRLKFGPLGPRTFRLDL